MERIGGTTRSPRPHGMLRSVRETSPALATGQARPETASVAYETWSILSIDYRRLGLCSAEPGGDGSALHVDRGVA